MRIPPGPQKCPWSSGIALCMRVWRWTGTAFCTPATAPRTCRMRGIKGVALTLNYDTVAEAERVFHALLADGGTVTMALQATFWAKVWGMLVDRFGTAWIVNGERLPF
jgi:uncharacterized glyoxalase superfamily protein PhnB